VSPRPHAGAEAGAGGGGAAAAEWAEKREELEDEVLTLRAEVAQLTEAVRFQG